MKICSDGCPTVFNIIGETGKGDKVAVFNERKATDQAKLAAIAKQKLVELQLNLGLSL